MVRGKKAAKERPPEEKLQQALVPVEEQPYLIPENWCWVRLGSLCTDIQYGYTAKAIFNNNYPKMLRITDIQGGEVDWDNVPNCDITENDFKKYELVSHDIVFARTGATTGKSYFVLEPPKSVYASYLIRIRLNSSFNKKYVYYILQSEVYWKQIMELSSGIAQPGVNAAKLQSLLCPLSPLSEQQRIVDRIESLFAKLDETKEKAQAVVDGFELRKSTILHKAFTGELTERWRKEHGVGLDSWKQLSIASICRSLKYGTAKKSEKSGPVVVLRMGNLQQGGIDWSDLAYSSDMDDIEKYRLEAGDVLFNRTNSAALVGKTSIYRGEYPAIYAGYLIKLDYDHEIVTGDFLNYALNTDRAKEYCNLVKTDGVNQSNINAKKIGAYVISVPQIDEQKEIVKLLQKLFALEKQAKEAAEAVLAQIDTMKKAILARAFRGELGTNNPEEEWAGELVKAIL